jgi:hypothetical protein
LWQPYGATDIATAGSTNFDPESSMAQEPTRTHSTPSIDTGAPLSTTPKPKGKGKWKIVAVLFLLVLPLAAFALWVTITLNYTYADGSRAGYVQKFSNKGFVCKTWEGELSMANGPNMMPELFKFSVRDDKVAKEIESMSGRQVKLSYEQHLGVPTKCFGETEYYVNKVEPLSGGPQPAGAALPAPATPAIVPPTAAPSVPPATVPSVPPATVPAPATKP